MSYRFDQQSNELVIDGFEKGISPSPYQGIANIQNLNTNYYPGVAYVNYRRQGVTLAQEDFYAGTHSINVSNNIGWQFTAPGTTVMGNPVQSATSPAGLNYILDSTGLVWKQSSVNSSTFNQLGNVGRISQGAGGIAYWNNYIVVFGAGNIEFCGNGTNDAGITGTNWNLNNLLLSQGSATGSLLLYVVTTISPTTTNIAATGFAVTKYQQVIFYTTGTLPAPLVAGQIYYATATATSGGNFQIASTPSGSNISFTTAGSTASGNVFVSILPMQLPNGNISSFNFTASVPPGATSATINSYVLPNGLTMDSLWLLASGNYNIVDQGGNNILAVFTNQSATVSFVSPIVDNITAVSLVVQILNPSVTYYRPYVSKVDGNLYFCNGRQVGRILSENTNIKFDDSNASSYIVDYAAFSVLDPNDNVVDMTDLQSTLVIAGTNKIYTWDYVSPSTSAPTPIGETIVRIKNLLNNIYILAGQKGNLYVSNGSYAQLLWKIPDYIAGAIDPVWTYGDMMTHRARIWFQAMAQNTSGSNILAGIFSLLVSPALIGETASGIVMEAQNSVGLVPASGSTGAGILIDDEPSLNGQDSYYSVYSTGVSTGQIDYNDTTLWQNFEPTIETDIIPIGTFLKKGTLGQVQFKLDREMASGDQIRIYSRPSLTDSYTLLGTTTTAVLGDAYGSNLSQTQWIQFKIQFKCASSSSSFIPLREVRVQYNPEI